MNPTILDFGVLGPGFLNQVPTLYRTVKLALRAGGNSRKGFAKVHDLFPSDLCAVSLHFTGVLRHCRCADYKGLERVVFTWVSYNGPLNSALPAHGFPKTACPAVLVVLAVPGPYKASIFGGSYCGVLILVLKQVM